MRVILAKSAGFCYGVERAVKLAEQTARDKGGCVMLGSIIHNAHVVQGLAALGARQVDDPAQVQAGDTVIIRSHGEKKQVYQQLEAAGVRVVVSDAQDIEGTYTAISMIGELVGRQAEAASIVESMQKTFDEIRANAGDGTKSIYFEVSPLQYGLWTAGSGTFMDEIANMLGLTNCFADVTGWGEISEEQVLERNPDYIVTISMYYGEGPTPEEEILSRTGWENVTAVKDGKILNLPNNELSRPAPRLADGAKALYDFVYGE